MDAEGGVGADFVLHGTSAGVGGTDFLADGEYYGGSRYDHAYDDMGAMYGDGYYDAGGASAFGGDDGVQPPFRQKRRRKHRTAGHHTKLASGAVHNEHRQHERSRRTKRHGQRHEIHALERPDASELAAYSIELWSTIEPAGGTDVATVASSGQPASEGLRHRLAEAKRETFTLKALLQDERKRIQREVKTLRAGWESADARARDLELQTLGLRCAEATLTRELSMAESLTGWWARAEAEGRKKREELGTQLRTSSAKIASLTTDLDGYGQPHSPVLRSAPLSCPPLSPTLLSSAQPHSPVLRSDPLSCPPLSPTLLSSAQTHSPVPRSAPLSCPPPRPTLLSSAQPHSPVLRPAPLSCPVGSCRAAIARPAALPSPPTPLARTSRRRRCVAQEPAADQRADVGAGSTRGGQGAAAQAVG